MSGRDGRSTTRLLFVRHGESVHTVEGFIGGPRSCRGLTAAGHAQAAAVAGRLAAELSGPVVVYSSTLRRAVETAAPIAAALGVAPEQDCGLCTWHQPPEYDGLPVAELPARRLPGGGVFRPFEADSETWAELVARTGRAIIGIAGRHRGATAVLVGHSETVEASLRALGLAAPYLPFDLKVAPASITEWRTDEDPWSWPPPRWTLTRLAA